MEKLAPPTPCTLIARPISYVTTYHLGYMYNVQYILYHLYLGILGMVQGLGFTTLPSNFGYEKNKCWGTGRGKKWASEHGKLPKFVDLTIAEMVGPKWWGALLHSRSLDISYFCIMPPLRLVLDLYFCCKTPSFSWWTPIFFMVKPPCFTLFSCLKTTIFQFTIPITTPFFTIIFQLPWSPIWSQKIHMFPRIFCPALDKVLGSAQLMLPPRSPRSKSRSGKAILVGVYPWCNGNINGNIVGILVAGGKWCNIMNGISLECSGVSMVSIGTLMWISYSGIS